MTTVLLIGEKFSFRIYCGGRSKLIVMPLQNRYGEEKNLSFIRWSFLSMRIHGTPASCTQEIRWGVGQRNGVFFELHFVEDQNPKLHVFVNDIVSSFLKSRNRMSALELNVARLHAMRIFKRVWPNAVYAKYQNKRCFKFVRPISTQACDVRLQAYTTQAPVERARTQH